MLRACIVYIPGSGGSFLRRALSLSDQSIVSDPNHQLSAVEKFKLFNNWTNANWKQSEDVFLPLYKTGQVEFHQFETSNLELIDLWHPVEFLYHDSNSIAWDQGAWPTLILINVDIIHKDFLEENQKTKIYWLDWDNEYKSLLKVFSKYKDKIISIDFDCLVNKNCFVDWTIKVDQQLRLELNLSLVDQLWDSWFSKSTALWKK